MSRRTAPSAGAPAPGPAPKETAPLSGALRGDVRRAGGAPSAVLLLMTLVALAGLYFGWRLFRFQTDDAYIAYRYVDQAVRGNGFVWNPPPFRPVEGYTSFLWVVLLRLAWTVFGLEPPAAADALTPLFAALQLLLVLRLAAGRLTDADGPARSAWLTLILAMVLTNRTFMAWTSSGLETSLFNFLVTGWVVLVLDRTSPPGRRERLLWPTVALLCLTRPDGYLFLAVTLAREGIAGDGVSRPGAGLVRALPWLAPVAAHLLWRRGFYGEWLPNTYFAKVGAPWYESGLRYLGCFMIEYGYWLAPLALLFALAFHPGRRAILRGLGDDLSAGGFRLGAVAAALALHTAYYVRIGGDHFEYRILSHWVPLAAVGTVWMLRRILPGRAAAALALLAFLAGLPIPWTHWALTKDRTTREGTFSMAVPVAPALPAAMGFLTGPFDRWQAWLVRHLVGNRHQEHKVFLEEQRRIYGPERRPGWPDRSGRHALALSCVGYPGWTLPEVRIIDRLGLNDPVIARGEPPGGERFMAHERIIPEGYLESFGIPREAEEDPARVFALPPDAEIGRIEATWRAMVDGRRKREGATPNVRPVKD